MLRAQRRRETVTEGGWAELPDELVAKVLELEVSQPSGWRPCQAEREAQRHFLYVACVG